MLGFSKPPISSIDVRSKGTKEAMYLIPRISNYKEAIYSSNHFRKLKGEPKKATGIDFRIKDFRSKFASLTVKSNPDPHARCLETV